MSSDFYYDAKITRIASLFETSIDGQSHRICRYRSRFSSQVKLVVNLHLEILKERRIFMETRNIKVGGGHLSFTRDIPQFRKLAMEGKERKKE